MATYDLSRRDFCFAAAGAALVNPALAPAQTIGRGGVIYAVRANGELAWNRHEGRDDGTFRWASDNGRQVGTGWGGLEHVFSGGDGIVYAVRRNGELAWNRHEGRDDGTFRWVSDNGRRVGTGWNGLRQAFAG